MKTNELKTALRTIVKEEIAARKGRSKLREAAGKPGAAPETAPADLPPRYWKLWKTLPKDSWEDFGRWVKARFNTDAKIPADLANKDVVDFLDKNPGTTRVPVTGLVDMYLSTPSIRRGIKRLSDEDFENLGTAVRAGASSGGETLATAGGAIGMTSQGASDTADRAEKFIKKFYPDGTDPRDLSDDQFTSLFGPGGKFDQAVEKAADIYTKLLVASRGNLKTFFGSLEDAGALAKARKTDKAESEYLSDAERVALTHLADLAMAGKSDVVKKLLKRDIDKELGDSNVIKSFQNLVSRLVRKDIDAADVAAGVKRPRGRPRKDGTTPGSPR